MIDIPDILDLKEDASNLIQQRAFPQLKAMIEALDVQDIAELIEVLEQDQEGCCGGF